MNLYEEEKRLDGIENQDWYPWRFSPLEMLVFLGVTIELVLIAGFLAGGW